MKGASPVGFWIAVLCIVLAIHCDCADPRSPRNVLLIVVDTLRPDHLGCYGADRNTSPSIDALAGRGVRFERAYATAPWTLPSVASMMTGVYPSTHQATSIWHKLNEETCTLPGVLRSFGYESVAIISHKLVGSKYGLAKDFDECDEGDAKGRTHISTPSITEKARALLKRLSNSDRPFFLFVHYFDPHYNYKAHPEYGFAAQKAGRLDGTRDFRELERMVPALDPDETQFLIDLYDEEIRFTDTGIGSLLATLKDLGLEESTLVVLTGDHGEEFREHGGLGHSRTLYEESMRVPLVIQSPGIDRGRIIENPVSLVSLAATILDLTGIDPTNLGGQGTSMAALLLGERRSDPQRIFFEVENSPFRQVPEEKRAFKRGLIQGNHKIIQNEESQEWELFDLTTDPLERENLMGIRPAIAEQLRSELEEMMRFVLAKPETSVEQDLTEEEQALLEGLGYIETD